MQSYAVIGAGYGDEGKGKVVSWLCNYHYNVLVVRYCGGHQAGHHVVLRNGVDHVFSNFGSGTAQGVPTYWSKYCTVDPIGLMREYRILLEKGIKPTLYIDRACPITTPHEKVCNIIESTRNKHGSCGVGVGATYEREEKFYSLLAEDLVYPRVSGEKLRLIGDMYGFRATVSPEDLRIFKQSCKDMWEIGNIELVDGIRSVCFADTNVIFEGSQGLLLDQHYGFFPHVTRANTGTTNIREMGFSPKVYLVTRSYQTRHGNGFLSYERDGYIFANNPYENNSDLGFQGKFRKSVLDWSMLKYAIDKDPYIRKTINDNTLVVTCNDVIGGCIINSKGHKICFEEPYQLGEYLRESLGLHSIVLSDNPYPEISCVIS
jgi:adenylosuccinate synthase